VKFTFLTTPVRGTRSRTRFKNTRLIHNSETFSDAWCKEYLLIG
jgi:hypothetical protein